MKKLSGLLLLAATLVAVAAPPPPPPDYFPLRVGDWWTYRTTAASGSTSEFTLKVTDFNKDSGQYTLETTAGAMVIDDWYSKPHGSVMWHKELYVQNKMQADFTPGPRQYLQNPLGKDATWNWSGTGMMGVQIDEKDAVVGSDPVTVAAGKFTGVHVHSDITQGGALVKKDYWYADHVGLVQSKTDSSGVQSAAELIDYSFKKK